MLAQMSGINVITFYSNTILQQDLGYSPILSRVISSCLQTWQFFAATSAIFLIDRIGRRRLLIGGAALMAIANAGLAGLQSHKDNATAAGCSLIFYFLALAAFPIGLFLIPFMYSAEIAPLRVRSQITAMSGGFNWLFNFLVAEVTPVAFDSIGWKYYLVSALQQRNDDPKKGNINSDSRHRSTSAQTHCRSLFSISSLLRPRAGHWKILTPSSWLRTMLCSLQELLRICRSELRKL
jgi:MFS family permease